MSDPADLESLCRLARLELPAAEHARLRDDLHRILDYVAHLEASPRSSLRSVAARDDRYWREDEPRAGLPRGTALRLAPEVVEDHFGVPAAVTARAQRTPGPADPARTSPLARARAADARSADVAGPRAERAAGPAGSRVPSAIPATTTRSTGAEPARGAAHDEAFLRDDAAALLSRIRRGETTARGAVQAALDRIAALDPVVRAFLSVDSVGALEQADRVDAARARGDTLPPLAGLPLAVKDNLVWEGWETTCASRILQGYRAPYTATAVRRLESAGAIVLGKTNLDEFSMGSSTENSAFHPTANPWDLARIPGGSSGGSAAAVAYGGAWAALGSDTGGSIRQPAAFCGIVGLKPAYGRVSRYGLVAFASSLDQVGPLGRTARDVALLFRILQGPDPLDPTSWAGEIALGPETVQRSVRGLRIGLPRSWLGVGLDDSVRRTHEEAARVLANAGANLVDVALPDPRGAIATYYVLADAEASSNLARFDGVRYGLRSGSAETLSEMYASTRGAGFGLEVKRRILLGTFVLSAGYYDAFYGKAQAARAALQAAFQVAWREADALLVPAAPTTAWRLGEKIDDPLAMYLSDVFTVPANLVGTAGVSFPAGRDERGLPVGLQLLGPSEEVLLRLVQAFEKGSGRSWSCASPSGSLP